MNAEKIMEEARNSISTFCDEDCKAYCCRKGYLVLKPDQADLVTQGRKAELLKNKMLKELKGNFSLNLSLDCPSLKDNKCTIHTHPNRPQACKDFPLFVERNWLKLSPRCLAVKMNKLYPYIHELLHNGYRLANSNHFSDSDFYKLDTEK
jgi:Fe-S-cluster containining protein